MNQRKTNMRTISLTIETAPDVEVVPQDVPIRRVRNVSPLISNLLQASDRRAHRRRLRAAEMAAWERTGGDYLRSDYFAADWKAA
jgi:hypothetical protein